MANDSSEKNLIRLNPAGGEPAQSSGEAGSILMLGIKHLDLSGLTEQQKQTLIMTNAEGMIAVNRKAQELVADAGALNHLLGTMAHHTKEIADHGGSVTMANVHDTSLGHTEIMVGTSDAAKSGKFSSSQVGAASNIQITNIVIIAATVIVVAVILASR